MPNHVTNRIRLTGDPQAIQRLLRAVAYDDLSEMDIPDGVNTIDFNKIIPQPAELYRGDLGKSEREKYKRNNWYDWNIGNWGTKSNSYGYGRETAEQTLCFDTAWAPPHPVIRKLSEQYPDIAIEHRWADEDSGYNCGRHTYAGGERIEEYYPDYGKEAIEFACGVKGCTPEENGLVLNAAGTDYICSEYPDFQVIEVAGQTALFANERLSLQDIPKGTYLYHLRTSDDGDRFATLERSVTVNHGGSVVTKEPINFGGEDHIVFTDETSPNFTGEEATFEMLLHDEIYFDLETDEITDGIGVEVQSDNTDFEQSERPTEPEDGMQMTL